MQLLRNFEKVLWIWCYKKPGEPQTQRAWCRTKRLQKCLLWSLEVVVLLLFCLGLVAVEEFVIVHPRPPLCDVVSMSLTKFSADNTTLQASHNKLHNSSSSTSHNKTTTYNEDSTKMLTAVIAITLSARNQIEHIGTFYDHVHTLSNRFEPGWISTWIGFSCDFITIGLAFNSIGLLVGVWLFFVEHLPCSVMVIYDGDVLVGEGWVGAFFQGHTNTDILHTQVEAHKLPLQHHTVAHLLKDINDGIVDLQVKIHLLTRICMFKYITHHFRVRITCNVMVTMSTAGINSTLLSKTCKNLD